MGEYQRKVESGRVPEKGPGEYWEMWDPSEYPRRARVSTGRRIGEGVESGRVLENHQTKKG